MRQLQLQGAVINPPPRHLARICVRRYRPSTVRTPGGSTTRTATGFISFPAAKPTSLLGTTSIARLGPLWRTSTPPSPPSTVGRLLFTVLYGCNIEIPSPRRGPLPDSCFCFFEVRVPRWDPISQPGRTAGRRRELRSGSAASLLTGCIRRTVHVATPHAPRSF